jgi:hypothetical protein
LEGALNPLFAKAHPNEHGELRNFLQCRCLLLRNAQ